MRLYDRLMKAIENPGRTAEKLYYDTAGEIEARDTANRADLTVEERKNTRPDIDRTDVVFAEGSGESYSIGYTDKNEPVVVVNDDILSNVTDEKDLISTVKKSLGRFKRVPIKGQSIYFVSDTKEEYINSKNSKYLRKHDTQKYYDKMRLAGHTQDIVYATTDYINEKPAHSRKDKIIDFARGNILFDVSGRKYTADVVIGFTKSGICELYDIVNIDTASFGYKKEATSKGMDSKESTRRDVTSIDNISEDTENVKENSEKTENSNKKDAFRYQGRGNGYDGYSMSNNAREAYENGEMPLSKWSKAEIINAISEINPDINCSKIFLEVLKEKFLEKKSWHHTSKFYNETDFYALNEDYVRKLTQDEVDNIVEKQKTAPKYTKSKTYDELAESSVMNDKKTYPDTKNHNFAKDGFIYRTAYFEDFDGSYYKITLSIGKNNGICTVYNVGQIKKDKLPSAKLIAVLRSKPRGNSSFNSSIPTSSENVKENSEKTENSNKNDAFRYQTRDTSFAREIKKNNESTVAVKDIEEVINEYGSVKEFRNMIFGSGVNVTSVYF